jgi:hypothetical protein
VLWAHSGFTYPDAVRALLAKHRNLWADLAYRNDYAPYGKLEAAWKRLILDFPDRFMVGTDTPSPERWYYVVGHARISRAWISELPPEVADNVAFRNAERLAAWALGARVGQ